MALNCENKLSADIIRNCDAHNSAGLETNVVLINIDDINRAALTLDVTNDLVVTDLATKSGTTGYLLEGVNQVFGASFELVPQEFSENRYKHTFSGVILTPSAANKKLLGELAGGGRYVAVVEKLFKGVNSVDAFEVLGLDVGLKVTTVTYSSKENQGVIQFELSSAEGMEEPKMPRNVLETDYATTKTSFDGKFATA